MKLKPCPFCGSRKLEIVTTIVRWGYVLCENCEASGPVHAEFVKAWNTRTERKGMDENNSRYT